MNKKILKFLIISLIIPSYTLAQESEFISASFNDEADSLQNLIEFPEFNENIDSTVRCSSELSRFGSFQSLVCLPSQYPELLQAIGDVVLDAQINPARRGGSRQRVMIPFSVRFVKEGSSENIFIYPNFGVGTEILGLDYTAPQRVIRRIEGESDECLFQISNYWVGVLVSTEGVPIEVSIAQPNSLTERCANLHSRVIGELSYIPAMKDGVPVQASYYEQSPLAGIERDNFQILNGAESAIGQGR